jgi:hypothetical protein
MDDNPYSRVFEGDRWGQTPANRLMPLRDPQAAEALSRLIQQFGDPSTGDYIRAMFGGADQPKDINNPNTFDTRDVQFQKAYRGAENRGRTPIDYSQLLDNYRAVLSPYQNTPGFWFRR